MGSLGDLFRSGKTNQSMPAAGVSIQSSVYGRPIPMIYGQTKVSGNMILYGNFVSQGVSQGGGGKGSLTGSGGGKSGGAGTTYNYSAAFAFAICEGPITNIITVYKSLAAYIPSSLGFSIFTGTYPQSAWGTTVSWTWTNEASVTSTGTATALGYNGIAYLAASSYDLGQSASLPNLQYQVQGVLWDSVPGLPDADPTQVISDFLTNSHYGLGFPSSILGNWTNWQNYCWSTGLLISPAYTTQRTASDMITEIMTATNSACFFSSGVLQVTPYGDATVSGNTRTYTPPLTPLYSLTDDDFLQAPHNNSSASASAATQGPVLLTRKRKSDTINSVKVEYLDQDNNYNPAVAYANNQGEIDRYGLRTNGTTQMHLFCNATAANLCANLQLRRNMVQNTYKFDLDQRYILLDPMDIIAITDASIGVNGQLVRIIEIVENDDQTLSFTCEEYMQGTGAAPAYTFATNSGQPLVNLEAAPGTMNQPIFFEPPFALSGGLEVWLAASGPSNWGGAQIFISTDGITYQFSGELQGSSRMGTLTAILPTFTQSLTGQTIDQVDTLAVDLTQSAGTLTSGNATLAQNFSTLCYVDGELISYGTATLTAANKYNLTYLVRGGYGSTIGAHAIGTNFVRVDNSLFKLSYTSDRIGQTIYVKFCSFNQYGGGQLSIASAPAYSYVIGGTALSGALASVSNLALAYIGNLMELNWTEISDYRPILYEIRVGVSWDSAQFLSRVAHPPFRIQGDGTYWVAAYSQPTAGLVIYSASPQSVNVVGSNIPQNTVVTWQEDPSWSGTLSGSVVQVGATIQSDGTGGGFYTIPVGHRVLITYPFACQVVMKWVSSASPLANTMFQFKGNATLTAGSTVISNLDIYSSGAQLQGTDTIKGISNTTSMGPGQWVTGTNVRSGSKIFAVLSTTTIQLTTSVLTGSTASPVSTSIKVIPFYAAGQVVESLTGGTATIPKGCEIASVDAVLDTIYLTTTALKSGSTLIEVSISMFDTLDFFGAVPPLYASVFPQLRMSTNGGGTWSAWQNWQAGYYLGNGFDVRVAIASSDVNTVAVLENFTFSVNVPDRIDHYNNFPISSLGSTIFFRPDGGTTAGFNGGQNGTTVPNILALPANQSAGQSVNVNTINLQQCLVSFYSSAGAQVAGNANIVAWGY